MAIWTNAERKCCHHPNSGVRTMEDHASYYIFYTVSCLFSGFIFRVYLLTDSMKTRLRLWAETILATTFLISSHLLTVGKSNWSDWSFCLVLILMWNSVSLVGKDQFLTRSVISRRALRENSSITLTHPIANLTDELPLKKKKTKGKKKVIRITFWLVSEL